MKKQTAKSTNENGKIFVAFGLDDHGKPRAARFAGTNIAMLTKAAQAMQLQLIEIDSPAETEVAQKLPTGRLYSTGRGFVPNIRGEVYTKLLASLGTKVNASNGGGTAPENVYPASYDEIAPGHVVLVQESLQYGWWEAVVLARRDETVTVRWRDYKAPEFVRHFDAVALIRQPAAAQPASSPSP